MRQSDIAHFTIKCPFQIILTYKKLLTLLFEFYVYRYVIFKKQFFQFGEKSRELKMGQNKIYLICFSVSLFCETEQQTL